MRLRAITAGITVLSTTGFRVTHVRPLFHRRAMTRSARARVSIRASMPGEGAGDYGPAQSLRQTRVALGDGTEMLVANTRQQSGSYTSQAVAETSSAADGFGAEGSSVRAYQSPAVESGLKAQLVAKRSCRVPIPGGSISLDASILNIALWMTGISIFTYKRIKTGSWLDWAVVQHTQSKGRRGVVHDEEDLKTLKQLSCGDCGYTVFPAMTRESRYVVDGQMCPICGSDQFYNKNDENDPRNIAADGTNLALQRLGKQKDWILASDEKIAELTAEARRVDQKFRTVQGRGIELGNNIQGGGFSNDPRHLKNAIKKGDFVPPLMASRLAKNLDGALREATGLEFVEDSDGEPLASLAAENNENGDEEVAEEVVSTGSLDLEEEAEASPEVLAQEGEEELGSAQVEEEPKPQAPAPAPTPAPARGSDALDDLLG